MIDPTLPLPGLSPVRGKSVVARFDGGLLSSNGGVLALREVERRLVSPIVWPPASTIRASRQHRPQPRRHHPLSHADDRRRLRGRQRRRPACAAIRCSRWRWTACRRTGTCARNRPSPGWRTCQTARRCCAWAGRWSTSTARSFRQVPKRIVLDIDDTFDAVHGGQQLRLFNAHYDEYGFQPIVVFDGEGRFVTAVLRPAKRPKGAEIRALLRRLVRRDPGHWPQGRILLRADSHYAGPEVLDWCRANGVDFILGLAPTTTLRRHVTGLEASTAARFEAAPTRARSAASRNSTTPPAGAGSSASSPASRPAADGTDTRFIVTNLAHGNAPSRSTRSSTAGAARRRTTSRRGRPTSPPTAPPAPRPPPTSSGCSCMPAPIG